MFVIDTNILIYYAAGEPAVVSFFEENKNKIFYIPTIVVAEFLSYSLITPSTAAIFKKFTEQTVIVNLDMPIAELAADIRKLHTVKLADAVIAASAIITRSSLVTRNGKDFKKISELEIVEL